MHCKQCIFMHTVHDCIKVRSIVKVNVRIQQFMEITSLLREMACHMGSHSITCHLAAMTFTPLPHQSWYSIKAELTQVVVTSHGSLPVKDGHLSVITVQCDGWDSNPRQKVQTTQPPYNPQQLQNVGTHPAHSSLLRRLSVSKCLRYLWEFILIICTQLLILLVCLHYIVCYYFSVYVHTCQLSITVRYA